jgi:hypothetical protein
LRVSLLYGILLWIIVPFGKRAWIWLDEGGCAMITVWNTIDKINIRKIFILIIIKIQIKSIGFLNRGKVLPSLIPLFLNYKIT